MLKPIPSQAGQWLDEFDRDRFWSNVDRRGGRPYLDDPLSSLDATAGECWTWMGKTDQAKDDSNGYGFVSLFGRSYPAHVVGFRDCGGSIPPGLQMDHLCRNRRCVRRSHLEAVTLRVNVERGKAGRSARPNCPHGHAYDDENTLWRTKGSRRYRVCLTCMKDRRAAA